MSVGSGISVAWREGTMEEYAALAYTHYHPRPPRAVATVRAAVDAGSGRVLGVLVVALPVLNAPWREAAFPGRYRTGSRKADARRVNAEVRTIARVVVDPRYRGMGVASGLVRAYLRDALTPVTDAVAAMGAFSGFFEAAGMRAYPMAPSARDLRLADAVASLGIEGWMLADPGLIPARRLGSGLLEREARRWAMGSRATRALACLELPELLRRAARIYYPATAYIALRRTSRAGGGA
jgi:GNAT superfamily N-acetyltransferase